MTDIISFNNPLNIINDNNNNSNYNKDIELNNFNNRSLSISDIESMDNILLKNQEDIYPNTDDSLLENLKDYDNVINYLYIIAMMDPDYNTLFKLDILKELSFIDSFKKFGYFLYYIFFRLSFLIYFIFYVIYFIYWLKNVYQSIMSLVILIPIINFDFVFVGYSLFNIYYISKKLNQQCMIINVPYFAENISLCYKFILISVLCEIPQFLNDNYNGKQYNG
jgi:hypothetical protein